MRNLLVDLLHSVNERLLGAVPARYLGICSCCAILSDSRSLLFQRSDVFAQLSYASADALLRSPARLLCTPCGIDASVATALFLRLEQPQLVLQDLVSSASQLIARQFLGSDQLLDR